VDCTTDFHRRRPSFAASRTRPCRRGLSAVRFHFPAGQRFFHAGRDLFFNNLLSPPPPPASRSGIPFLPVLDKRRRFPEATSASVASSSFVGEYDLWPLVNALFFVLPTFKQPTHDVLRATGIVVLAGSPFPWMAPGRLRRVYEGTFLLG